jgi:hypothetical protein
MLIVEITPFDRNDNLPLREPSHMKGDPSSIHFLSASYSGHCWMNGFGMTICSGHWEEGRNGGLPQENSKFSFLRANRRFFLPL